MKAILSISFSLLCWLTIGADEKQQHKLCGVTYVQQEELGSGSHAKVYKAHAFDDPKKVVAIKIYNEKKSMEYFFQNGLTEEQAQKKVERDIKREIKVLRFIKDHPHENIIGVICLEDKKPVMELCDGGTLLDTLKESDSNESDSNESDSNESDSNDQLKTLNERQLQEYTFQLSKILTYLAQKGIIHHDIKLENLCFQRGKLKLIDFGFAQRTESSTAGAGSRFYKAPEIQRGKYHTNKVDIYSVGVTMYIAAFSTTPERPFKKQIILPPPEDFPNVSPEIRDLIVKCMEPNPERRYSHVDFQAHPYVRQLVYNWFSNLGYTYSWCCRYKPSRAWTSTVQLAHKTRIDTGATEIYTRGHSS